MVRSTSPGSNLSLGWNHSGQLGSVAQEETGPVRVSLDEREPGATRFWVALVGRHVVRWLRRKMSSIRGAKWKGGFMSWLAMLMKC